MPHEKWLQRQLSVAVELGINPLDAQKSLRAFLDLLPCGADPDTYIVPAERLEQDITSQALRDDAVADWVANEAIPARFKLLLVAGEDSQ